MVKLNMYIIDIEKKQMFMINNNYNNIHIWWHYDNGSQKQQLTWL